jgi:anti-sigma factor RsiW
MICREVVEFLTEYLSGEMQADQWLAFEQHLEACPECVAYVKSYEETVRLGKAVFSHPDERIPEDVPEDLVQAILAARKKRV